MVWPSNMAVSGPTRSDRKQSLGAWPCFVQNLVDCALSGLPIQRVGVPSELYAFKQSLHVAGHSVCGHDQCRIERVDVFARD